MARNRDRRTRNGLPTLCSPWPRSCASRRSPSWTSIWATFRYGCGRPAPDHDGGELRLENQPLASIEPDPPEILITAPMIGTFYAAATPGAPPFVVEGDEVYIGQTIGIIEAMKIMNEIAADRTGVVEAVLVSNGQPVEYGSPLMRLGAGRSNRG